MKLKHYMIIATLIGLLAIAVVSMFNPVGKSPGWKIIRPPLDVMAIAQGITVLSDYVMLNWKIGDIVNKLEDIYARLMRLLKEDPMLENMKSWLDRLREFSDDDTIPESLAEELGSSVERWDDAIKRKIAPE